jgi:hypothetical protein
LRDFESRKYAEITRTGDYIDTWELVQLDFDEEAKSTDSLVFRRKQTDKKWSTLVYYPFGLPDHNAYTQNGSGDLDNYWCYNGSKLAERSPGLNEKLVLSGRDADGKYVTQPITIDWLDKSKKDGREKILSLTHAQNGWAFVGEPVFNRNHELVGFVEAYSPGHSLGITIRSVHDPIFGMEVNRWIAQKDWKPMPPANSERGPSPRVSSLCLCWGRIVSEQYKNNPELDNACTSKAK